MSLLEITLLKSSSPDLTFSRKRSVLNARRNTLSKISSISKNFNLFYDSDRPKVLQNKELGRLYYLGIPTAYNIISFIFIFLALVIPNSYFLYIDLAIIFVSLFPPILDIYLESNSHRREKLSNSSKSIIAYLTARDSSLFLSQIFSLIIITIRATTIPLLNKSTPIYFIYILIGITIGIFIIISVIRRYVGVPAHILEDHMFRASFKPARAAIHIRVRTKYEKMEGMLISIGDYLIIENKESHRWSVDWDKIIDVIFLGENPRYKI